MKHMQDTVYTATAVTQSENSDAIDLREVYGLATQITWTKNSGTLTGGVKLQVSTEENPSTWSDLLGYSCAFGDESGSTAMHLDCTHYAWMRYAVTIGAGSGNIDISASLSTKG